MKKQLTDFIIKTSEMLTPSCGMLTLMPVDGSPLPEIKPGQFVEVAVNSVMLRRPISICDVDYEANELRLLIRNAGKGTSEMLGLPEGSKLNILLPLGNGFTFSDDVVQPGSRMLLVGGGVGTAPLLYLGRILRRKGAEVTFLTGAKTSAELLLVDEMERIAPVAVTTDDGSEGEKGFVVDSTVWQKDYDRVYCCGPAPMMKAVAALARRKEVECEVSLENMMACGLGACLCCVEKTVKGNVCVCSEGPVFNINELTW
ncbi:MAG: dihydroorotate dehydrogenase electron transfer subunit [Muribaculaceae bacterium]|nr:dihydroorotate dehydrogenase electron transfer subunit [Muribaculaceae bacterium]